MPIYAGLWRNVDIRYFLNRYDSELDNIRTQEKSLKNGLELLCIAAGMPPTAYITIIFDYSLKLTRHFHAISVRRKSSVSF